MSRQSLFGIVFVVTAIILALALPVSAQDSDAIPMIEVADQLVLDGTVMIDHAYSDGPGFIVIHADNGSGGPGPVAGYQAVDAGESHSVKVAVNTAAVTPTLFAMLHTDTGVIGEYEFGTVDGADGPVRVDDAVVAPAFAVSMIHANDQFVEDGAVRIAAVMVAERSWVVIHSDADGKPGPVLGQTLVNPGNTASVLVALRGEATSVLWPMLHVDSGASGEYEFGTVEGVDGPVRVGEQVAVTSFWTVPHVRPADGMELMGAPLVVADFVLSEGSGWLVIHSDADGKPGPVLGWAAVQSGLNTDVAVELSPEGLTSTLWLMLHVDTGTVGEYEFGTVEGADGPVRVDDAVVVVPLAVPGEQGGGEMGGESAMSALDGNALVDTRCTTCHSRDRIDNASKDRAGWESTVDRMIDHGAQLDADEREAVIEYLTNQ